MKIKCNKIISLVLCVSLWSMTQSMRAQRIVFMPQFESQSQFAGYYAAYEKGFYREAGIDVRFKPADPFRPALQSLYQGRCDMITSEAITALVSMEKSPRVVNILQTAQHSTLMVIARKPGVKSLRDLKGCKVGTWKSGFSELPRSTTSISRTYIG